VRPLSPSSSPGLLRRYSRSWAVCSAGSDYYGAPDDHHHASGQHDAAEGHDNASREHDGAEGHDNASEGDHNTSFSFSSSLGFGPTVVEGRSAAAGSSSSSGSKHVLGVDVTALAPQILAKEIGKSPFAMVVLGLAVLLLGLAAVPQAATPGPRTADLLARRRSAMILAGGVAIAAGVIFLGLS
jgi:hypothetical protein